jgi:hypothetical protein
MSPTSKPSVLAITEDVAILRANRIDMPLVNMKRQGLIDDYFVTNPTLLDVPDDFRFDVVWLQRVLSAPLIEHLSKRIENHYLYDLDDLLVGRAAYRTDELTHQDTVLNAVEGCRVLTVSSIRLASLLQKYTRKPLMEKALVCPNGFEFPPWTRSPSVPEGILLSSSESLPLTNSKPAILKALTDFSKRHDLPVYSFSREADVMLSGFHRVIPLGYVSFWHYHALLACMPPMIGIAPLETDADEQTIDFVNSKSDIKMVDFGGFGHPSVYSKARPFVDTELKAGILVENSVGDWSEGLEQVYQELWRRLDIDQEGVRMARNMDRIAAESWQNAVCRARLPDPMTGKQIKYPSGTARRIVNVARYMAFSQSHSSRRMLKESVPPRLGKLIRRFLLKG